MAKRTALINPAELLKLSGIDDIERQEGAPNPFWNRKRFEITWGLPEAASMTEDSRVETIDMREATTEELRLFHDPSYIETLDLFGNMGMAFSTRFGLPSNECPIFPEVNQYARLTVGGTIDAVMGVARGEYKNAMSFYAGFHHAMSSRASGFSYLNDIAVAINVLRNEFPGTRILYLDTDVHHADGVQNAFYHDSDVLTISIHEKSMGFFPGSGNVEEIGIGEGKGYSVNIPLPPLTDDIEYWRVFEETVIPIWNSYQPDFVIWNLGADAHMEDPLADLLLTLDSYNRLSKTVQEMVYRNNQKLVVLGAGGYSPITAARVYTLILSDLAGICLPPTFPDSWVELCEKHRLVPSVNTWIDKPIRIAIEHLPKIRGAIDRTLKKVRTLIFPILGI